MENHFKLCILLTAIIFSTHFESSDGRGTVNFKRHYPDEIEYCIEICYNQYADIPNQRSVCGTDGITYIDQNHLRCAQTCGRNVRKYYNGPCCISERNQYLGNLLLSARK